MSAQKDIVKHPFMTGFCRSRQHEDGQPQELCPVIIKHDRSAKVWVCTCPCHEGQDVGALLDEKQSSVSEIGVELESFNSQGMSAVLNGNGRGQYLNQLRDALESLAP